jgi:hypothetical protein
VHFARKSESEAGSDYRCVSETAGFATLTGRSRISRFAQSKLQVP